MNALQLIEHVLETRHVTKYRISVDIGKHKNYVGSTMDNMRKGGDIGVDKLAAILNSQGFQLVAVDNETGETIEIEPNENSQ